MPRTYVRKFDWDEAKRRHDAGESYAALGREFGVSATAVVRACNEDVREAYDRRARAWMNSGRCPDCGTQTTRAQGSGRRCVKCNGLAMATSVRDDALRCVTCREWKPDEEFSLARRLTGHARRGRNEQCRQCQTNARRSHRQRNREADNTYQREYKRRKRSEGADSK